MSFSEPTAAGLKWIAKHGTEAKGVDLSDARLINAMRFSVVVAKLAIKAGDTADAIEILEEILSESEGRGSKSGS